VIRHRQIGRDRASTLTGRNGAPAPSVVEIVEGVLRDLAPGGSLQGRRSQRDPLRVSPRFEGGEEGPDAGDRLTAQERRLLLVVFGCQEGGVGRWAIVGCVHKALSEKSQGLDDRRIGGDWACSRRSAGILRSVAEVEQTKYEVVGVFVVVPILEGPDLEDDVGEETAYPYVDSRQSAIIESLGLDLVHCVVGRDELGAANVECSESRANRLALGPEDAACLDLVRLAEELDLDGDAVDERKLVSAPKPERLRFVSRVR
jgi:hypothetical protein